MKTVIEINMDNEAFGEDRICASGEVARILRILADAIDGHPHYSPGFWFCLGDANGNEVGYCAVREG